MTVHVKRAATGETETYELVGRVVPQQKVHHGTSGTLAGEDARIAQEGSNHDSDA